MSKPPPRANPAAKALEVAAKPAEIVSQTLERALDPLHAVLKHAALKRATAWLSSQRCGRAPGRWRTTTVCTRSSRPHAPDTTGGGCVSSSSPRWLCARR